MSHHNTKKIKDNSDENTQDLSNLFKSSMVLSGSSIEFEHTGYEDNPDLTEYEQYSNDENLWIFTINSLDTSFSFDIYEKSVSYYTISSLKNQISRNLRFFDTQFASLVMSGRGACLNHEYNQNLYLGHDRNMENFTLSTSTIKFRLPRKNIIQMLSLMMTEKLRLYADYFYGYCDNGFYHVDINNELNTILPLLESKGIVIDVERCQAMEDFERESARATAPHRKKNKHDDDDDYVK